VITKVKEASNRPGRKRIVVPTTVLEFLDNKHYLTYAKKVFTYRYRVSEQDLPDIMQELSLRLYKNNYLEKYDSTKGATFKTYFFALLKSIGCAYFKSHYVRDKNGGGRSDPNNLYLNYSFDFVNESDNNNSNAKKTLLDFYIEDSTNGHLESNVMMNDFIDRFQEYIRRSESKRADKQETIENNGEVYKKSLEQIFILMFRKHYNKAEIARCLDLTPADISYYVNRIKVLAEMYLKKCRMTTQDLFSL